MLSFLLAKPVKYFLFIAVVQGYIASRRRSRYFFIKREFDSNRNAQMVRANAEITFCGPCGAASRKEIEFRELGRDSVSCFSAVKKN